MNNFSEINVKAKLREALGEVEKRLKEVDAEKQTLKHQSTLIRKALSSAEQGEKKAKIFSSKPVQQTGAGTSLPASETSEKML